MFLSCWPARIDPAGRKDVKEKEIKELQELELPKLEVCKFIAPRVVEKAIVTLPSYMVKEREASLCTPSS